MLVSFLRLYDSWKAIHLFFDTATLLRNVITLSMSLRIILGKIFFFPGKLLFCNLVLVLDLIHYPTLQASERENSCAWIR